MRSTGSVKSGICFTLVRFVLYKAGVYIDIPLLPPGTRLSFVSDFKKTTSSHFWGGIVFCFGLHYYLTGNR